MARSSVSNVMKAANRMSAAEFEAYLQKNLTSASGGRGPSRSSPPARRKPARKSSDGVKKSPGGKHLCGCMLGLKK